jgi:hypothetical protein
MKKNIHALACTGHALVLSVATSILLSACGGGGGGGGGSAGFGAAPPTSSAAPTVSVQLSAAKVSVGQSVTLSWSSTNTASCTGADAWSAAQASSGETTITPNAGGRYTYTLTCVGPGGNATASALLVVPMPVLATSYENKNTIALDNPTIPSLFSVKNITREPGEVNFSQRSVAFADFLQDGAYDTAVTYSTFYKGVDTDGSNPNKGPDSPAKLYFLHKDDKGVWSDITADLIKDSASRYTCVTPGFVQVADLNNDGRPDVFTGCTGPDYQFVSRGNAWQDLSAQYVVLSQPDGGYKVVQLGVAPIYAHQASLADVDGDGNVDIISADTSSAVGGHRKPLVMWGHGDGTFQADYGVFPADTLSKSIYGVLAMPINGKLDVILSGNPNGSHPADASDYGTRVLQFANGSFQYVGDLSAGIPQVSATGLNFGLMLDAIYKDGFLYTMRTSFDYAYEGYIKTDFATGASVVLRERASNLGNGNTSAGSSGMLKITSGDALANQMADCDPGIQPGSYFYEVCSLRIPVQ